jgi:hypothetical protein
MKRKQSQEYLVQLRNRYKKAKRTEKNIMLSEFVKTTAYDRKHAGKLLRGAYEYTTKPIKRPKKRRYEFLDAIVLYKICELLDWINSKRIQPQIEIAIDSLVEAGELTCSLEQKLKLKNISPATIDRLLKTYKQRPLGRGRSYTKPGTLLKQQIPVRTFADWNEDKVGFEEIDLVGHDGGVVRGDFGWTLNFIDVKSCWAEQVAVKNKAQVYVFAGICRIRERLPFALLGLDSDSGSEFINHHLNRYCNKEKITFTRGRAAKKNDQAYVEQKNDSIVRRWIGYSRYDTEAQMATLNQLYEILRLYLNFYIPVMKLKEKVKIGSKVIKRYDKPTTPYQRLLQAVDVSKEVKDKLNTQYQKLSLTLLKRQIDMILKDLKPTPVGQQSMMSQRIK